MRAPRATTCAPCVRAHALHVACGTVCALPKMWKECFSKVLKRILKSERAMCSFITFADLHRFFASDVKTVGRGGKWLTPPRTAATRRVCCKKKIEKRSTFRRVATFWSSKFTQTAMTLARDFENLSIFQIDRGESSFILHNCCDAQSKAFKAFLKEKFRLAPPLRAQNDAASKITKKQFFWISGETMRNWGSFRLSLERSRRELQKGKKNRELKIKSSRSKIGLKVFVVPLHKKNIKQQRGSEHAQTLNFFNARLQKQFPKSTFFVFSGRSFFFEFEMKNMHFFGQNTVARG